MADVHHLPDLKRIEREASEWVARLRADDVSADDLARFEIWRSAHVLNARAYEELEGTWRLIAAAGPLVRAVSFAQSMNEATALPDRQARAPRRRVWLAAAASIVVAIASFSIIYATRLSSERTYSTAIGDRATIALADGSTLELNSGSLASVRFSTGARVIHLQRGEAFFNVAHDATRPFWVVGGGSWVRAVGTAFNVYLRPAGVQVTVSEGTVRVGVADPRLADAPSDQALARATVSVLTAGNQATISNASTAQRQLSTTELGRLVAWRSGLLYFENRPLSDVVDELGRYTPVQLVIDDEKLRELPVGGSFQANAQGAESLLLVLQQGFGLNVRREGDRAYIEQKR